MPEYMHLALGIHDPSGDYACHAGATLASVFSRTSGPVCAHVVHNDTLTAENARQLQAIAQRFGKELCLHSVQLPEAVQALGGQVTQGALYRLLLPKLTETAKIIYFDCDIIVNLDIQELWKIDLQQHPVAAVLDQGVPEFPPAIKQRMEGTGVSLHPYFNSGVLVMNLEVLRRKHRLFEEVTGFIRQHPDAVFYDQDALNWLFQTTFLPLEPKFNKIVSRTRRNEEFRQPAVWHFAGVKPWLHFTCSQDMLYWKALALTPWQTQLFDRMSAAIFQTLNGMNDQLQKTQTAYDDLRKKYDQLVRLQAQE